MTAPPLLTSALAVRPATPADADALLALHRDGFGSAWELSHWRWRFVDNPLRRTEIIGAFSPDGRCLATFCGVPLPCLYGNEAALVQLAGDVIVHARLRQSVAGASLMLRVANQFMATFGGEPTRLVVGFPQPGLCRMMVRRCCFEVMFDVAVLVRSAAANVANAFGWTARTDHHFPDDVQSFSQRWHRDVTTGILRDARYLRWRYQDNPHATYRIVTVRSASGSLRGLAVLRPDDEHDDTMLVVEWLVLRGDADATRALLDAAERHAVRACRPSLVVGFAPTSPEFATFQAEHGFRVVVTEHRLVHRSFAAGLNRRFLFANWFHSLGDMDCT